MLFRKVPLVSDDMAEWILESFEWELAHDPTPRRLIRPTGAFFSATRGEDGETARAVLADVCRHMGVTRPFRLEPLPELADEWSHEYGKLSEVAGTYAHDANDPVIQYSAKGMRRPVGFINTMAHEVMHDRLHGYEAALPGGPEAHELSTDLHCVILGFGLFQLAAADEIGWSGCLSQASRAYALELFLALWAEEERGEALGFLSGRVGRLMKQAGRMGRLGEDVARLRAFRRDCAPSPAR